MFKPGHNTAIMTNVAWLNFLFAKYYDPYFEIPLDKLACLPNEEMTYQLYDTPGCAAQSVARLT